MLCHSIISLIVGHNDYTCLELSTFIWYVTYVWISSRPNKIRILVDRFYSDGFSFGFCTFAFVCTLFRSTMIYTEPRLICCSRLLILYCTLEQTCVNECNNCAQLGCFQFWYFAKKMVLPSRYEFGIEWSSFWNGIFSIIIKPRFSSLW